MKIYYIVLNNLNYIIKMINITLNENIDIFTMIGISITFFIGTSIILWIMMFILCALAYVFPCVKPIYQCCDKVLNSK